jgi:hypothetical protein
VFEVVVDDYTEVWVDGAMPLTLGLTGGKTVAGFNAPNRVVLTQDARPGQRFQIAVFGINGPISASPGNYIWIRTATLDFYAADRAEIAREVPHSLQSATAGVDAIVPADAKLEQIAGGFEFIEGPVWTPDGTLLFSSPNTNVIYRWAPSGTVTVFRSKSGYSGVDIGDYTQPGAPDKRHLYVGNWDPAHKVVMRYDVDPHGHLSGGTVFFDMTDAPGDDAIDGLKVDQAGNLYVCGPGGVWLLSPEGRHLGTLGLPEPPHNLAWGDEDGRALYVTALTSIYRIRLNIPGIRPH